MRLKLIKKSKAPIATVSTSHLSSNICLFSSNHKGDLKLRHTIHDDLEALRTRASAQ